MATAKISEEDTFIEDFLRNAFLDGHVLGHGQEEDATVLNYRQLAANMLAAQ